MQDLLKDARDEGLVKLLIDRAKDEISDRLLSMAEEKEADL